MTSFLAAMQVLLGQVSQMGHKIARAGSAGTIKLLLWESRVHSVSSDDPCQMNFALRQNNLNFAEIERFKMAVESNLTTRVARAAITGIGKIYTLYVYIQGVFLTAPSP